VGKFVAGDVAVLPFPQTGLQVGKRRPALVLVSLPGDDLILCQITSQTHRDSYAVALDRDDFEKGHLAAKSFARPTRLFTVAQSVIVYAAARLESAKLETILSNVRELFKS
jgi:mRNA interferase MazF